jgi:hypothetical protein
VDCVWAPDGPSAGVVRGGTGRAPGGTCLACRTNGLSGWHERRGMIRRLRPLPLRHLPIGRSRRSAALQQKNRLGRHRPLRSKIWPKPDPGRSAGGTDPAGCSLSSKCILPPSQSHFDAFSTSPFQCVFLILRCQLYLDYPGGTYLMPSAKLLRSGSSVTHALVSPGVPQWSIRWLFIRWLLQQTFLCPPPPSSSKSPVSSSFCAYSSFDIRDRGPEKRRLRARDSRSPALLVCSHRSGGQTAVESRGP